MNKNKTEKVNMFIACCNRPITWLSFVNINSIIVKQMNTLTNINTITILSKKYNKNIKPAIQLIQDTCKHLNIKL
jgi:hypothetical protein